MAIHKAGKYIIAFTAATAVANAVLYFYYVPVIYVRNPEAFTDVRHAVLAHNVQAVEGYGNQVIDKYGFHNAGGVTPDSALVVCTGSSQTAAEHVPTEKNYVSRLNSMDRELKVYNVGVNKGTFADIWVRIRPLKKKFPVAHTLVFEINAIPGYEDLLRMKNQLEQKILPERQGVRDSVIYKIVQRIPFIRLMRYKYVQLRASGTKSKANISSGGVNPITRFTVRRLKTYYA